MIAAPMLLMKPAREAPPAPPRDGRHLIYDDAGRLVRIEHYEAGERKRVEEIGPDGTIKA